MMIAERITRTREIAGLTKSELSRLLLVDRSAVSHWEAGRREPSASMCAEIASVCGVELVEFWG